MPSRTRIVRLVAAVVALGVLGCAVLATRSARRAMAGCHPPHKAIRADDRARARAAATSLEEVSFRTTDDLTLRGWWVPSKNGAAVVFVHGWFDNRAHWLPDLLALAERGFGVLAYDSRGSGESDGDLTTAGDREQRDVTAAIDFVTARPGIVPTRIGLVGFSFGSSAVALTAAKDARPRAILLEATWTSLEDEMRYKNRKWGPVTQEAALWGLRHEGLDLGNVRPIDHMREIRPRPLLLVIGALDDDTPVPIMEKVLAAAGAPTELWIVPGAHHGDYAEAAPNEYLPHVVSFFEGALLR
jgi:dipeptidyl aminopeptidase/acylaminoacyl peptidase